MKIKTVNKEGYTVQVVDFSGTEWAKVQTLAKAFNVSSEEMRKKIIALQQTHEVKVLFWGERSLLVHVADFHRALMDCVPVSTQLARGV